MHASIRICQVGLYVYTNLAEKMAVFCLINNIVTRHHISLIRKHLMTRPHQVYKGLRHDSVVEYNCLLENSYRPTGPIIAFVVEHHSNQHY